jgi:redox-sensitive bicupin YhaK (pirin superfamily)
MLGRRKLVLGGAASLALACTPAPSVRARRAAPAREVEQVVVGRRSVDGAGVSLLRLLGTPALPHLDPFVLLDELHSRDPREYEAGFPTHPHRGFETVTIMLEGRMRHRDSRGNAGLIEGGGGQWMTAGSGILHSEMPERPASASTELWGFQLWVNLPEAERWRTPEYQDLTPDRLAEVALDRGGRLRVLAGEALGARGPVAPRATEPLLATVALAAGEDLELTLPRAHAAMVVVAEGTAAIGGRRQRVAEDSLVVTGEGSRLRLGAPEGPAQLVVIAGRPLREPFVHRGPFVMGTMEDIEEAFADHRAGRLG